MDTVNGLLLAALILAGILVLVRILGTLLPNTRLGKFG